MSDKQYQVVFTDEEWRKKLTPEQYQILRKKGTERPFTGKYDNFFAPGFYTCAGCGSTLFESESKFNSGCGWPAFDKSVAKDAIDYHKDHSFGMTRIEIVCANCGGHLGHVFDDGPTETGQRYCVNSASIDFQAE